MLKVREVSRTRLETILASLNIGVNVQILPNHHSTYFYIGVSIYKVKVLSRASIDLLNKHKVTFTYFDKFID